MYMIRDWLVAYGPKLDDAIVFIYDNKVNWVYFLPFENRKYHYFFKNFFFIFFQPNVHFLGQSAFLQLGNVRQGFRGWTADHNIYKK